MNLLISFDWLKEYLKIDVSPELFAERTTEIGNSVEHLLRPAEALQHVCLGIVKEIAPHPSADRLRLTRIDIGKEIVDIVCGGTNLSIDQRVAVALPGARVRWHGEGDLVTLEETSIRGVKSFGMICAPAELGFEKVLVGPQEIWDLTGFTEAKAGTPLAEALELEDTIFDIEVTSNRPDAMSVIGQAREGAAAVQGSFHVPSSTLPKGTSPAPKVTVQAPELCSRYMAVLVQGVKVGPSPWWLQKRLLLSGHRPINNVVDVTNYILHAFGQPLHAFDAQCLQGGEIHVRLAKEGERILALDGKTYALSPSMLVIADTETPKAIAGVMGGEASGVTSETTSVLVEAAVFDPVSIRRTSRALHLTSDASQLFEKGLSPEALPLVLARAVELLHEVAGATSVSLLSDVYSSPQKTTDILFDPDAACRLMGFPLAPEEMKAILERLGFLVKKKGKVWHVGVPSWRAGDVSEPWDLVEEIARVFGYRNIPPHLPQGALPEPMVDPLLFWERRVKEILAGAGASEVYGSSFTSARELSRGGFAAPQAVKLANPLSEDQEYLRPSLLPGLLSVVSMNEARLPEGLVFECGSIHHPSTTNIPHQEMHLALAAWGRDGEEAFRHVKGLLTRLLHELHITSPLTLTRDADPAEWHATRSAHVHLGGVLLGTLGEIAPTRAAAAGVRSRLVIASLNFESLIQQATTHLSFNSLPLFPEVVRDLSFLLPEQTQYETLAESIRTLDPLIEQVSLFDVFRGKGIEPDKKSMGLRLTFRSPSRTLTSEEVDALMARIREELSATFQAVFR